MVDGGLAELHTHLGGSVASDILWSLAHEQGIALPVKDFWEFDRLVTVSDPQGVQDLDALDEIYRWTELIQSSPLAVERSVHAAIGGAYRSQGITTLELRFNPMKRNRGGERDLDHIIMAAVRGLDRASLEYPQVRAGLILMMDRTFSERAERDHRREGDSLRAARDRRHRHRRPAACGGWAVSVRRARAARRTGSLGRSRGDDPRRRGRRRSRHRRDPRRRRLAPPGADRARDPGRSGRDVDGRPARARDHARGLPDVEPADEGAARRGRGSRHLPRLLRGRCAVHDRHGRARDDGDAPAGRVRPARCGSARSTSASWRPRTGAATTSASSPRASSPNGHVQCQAPDSAVEDMSQCLALGHVWRS